MLRRALLSILFFSIVPAMLCAQQYHWRRTLPFSCRSVAFNPLSNGRIIFAGPSHEINGIFRSDDGGLNWTLHNTDTLALPLNNVHQILCLPGDTNIVLAVTPNILYRSTNGGMSWYIISDSIGGIDGECMAWHAADSTVYYGQNFGYALWKSSDLGATWHQTGFANPDSIGLCALDVSVDALPTIIQGSQDTGLLARSTDDGVHWVVTLDADTGKNNETEVPKVVFSDYAIGASGLHDVALAIRWLSKYRSLVATTDGGVTWSTLPSPSDYPWALDVDQRAAMISQPGDHAFPLPLHFFIGLFGVAADTIPNGMVQQTTDGGATWQSTNFPSSAFGDTLMHYVWVLKFDTASKRIAIATDSGVFLADTTTSIVQTAPLPAPELSITEQPGFLDVTAAHPILNATLFDMLGRVIQQFQPQYYGAERFTISTAAIPAGVYALDVSLFGENAGMRMVVLP